MSDEEESLIIKRIFEYESSPDAFSQLVETYCTEYGRERVRPYLIPIQRPKSEQADINQNRAATPKTCKKSRDSSKASSSKNDDDSPLIVVCDDEICGVKNPIKDVSPVTSRKLEWDSLADIGYANENQIKDSHTLSTIERIALSHHHDSNLTVNLKDDIYIKYKSSVGLPVAQSTPVSPTVEKPPKKKQTCNTSVVSHPCKSLKCKRRFGHVKLNSKSNPKRKVSYNVCINANKSRTSVSTSNPKSTDDTVEKNISTDSAKSDPLVKISSRITFSTPSQNETINTDSPFTKDVNKFKKQRKNSPLHDTESIETDNVSSKCDSSKIPSMESEKITSLQNTESIDTDTVSSKYDSLKIPSIESKTNSSLHDTESNKTDDVLSKCDSSKNLSIETKTNSPLPDSESNKTDNVSSTIPSIESKKKSMLHDTESIKSDSISQKCDCSDTLSTDSKKNSPLNDRESTKSDNISKKFDSSRKSSIESKTNSTLHDRESIKSDNVSRKFDSSRKPSVESKKNTKIHDRESIKSDNVSRKFDSSRKPSVESKKNTKIHDRESIKSDNISRKFDSSRKPSIESKKNTKIHDRESIKSDNISRKFDSSRKPSIESKKNSTVHDKESIKSDNFSRKFDSSRKSSIESKTNSTLHDRESIKPDNVSRKYDSSRKPSIESKKNSTFHDRESIKSVNFSRKFDSSKISSVESKMYSPLHDTKSIETDNFSPKCDCWENPSIETKTYSPLPDTESNKTDNVSSTIPSIETKKKSSLYDIKSIKSDSISQKCDCSNTLSIESKKNSPLDDRESIKPDNVSRKFDSPKKPSIESEKNSTFLDRESIKSVNFSRKFDSSKISPVESKIYSPLHDTKSIETDNFSPQCDCWENPSIETKTNSPLHSIESTETDNLSPNCDCWKIMPIKSKTNYNRKTHSFCTDNSENIETSPPATVASTDYDNYNVSAVDSFEFIPGNVYTEKKIQFSGSSSIHQSDPNIESEILIEDFNQPCSCDSDIIDHQNAYKSTIALSGVSSHSLDSICRLVETKHSDPNVQKSLVKKIIQLLSAEYITEDNSTSTKNTSSSTKLPLKNFVECECQTDADLIPKGLKTSHENIPSTVNIENSKIIEEKSCNESQTVHKYSQTSPISSSSNSTTNKEYLKKKDQQSLKKEKVIEKIANLEQRKKNLSCDRSDDSNDYKKDLNTINNKILKLLILKFKLENTDCDKYLGSMHHKITNEKSDSQISSTEIKSHRDIQIPPLNLKINSDNGEVFSDNAKLSLTNCSDYQNQREPIKISRENSCEPKEELSKRSTDKSESNLFSNPCSTERKSDSNIKIPPLNLKISSDDSEVFSDNAKLSLSNHSNNKKQLEPLKISNEHSNDSCNCELSENSKPCSFCENNTESDLLLTDDKKPIDYKVKKLKETYSKYRKCHVLKKFLKEYDLLIEKYQKLKISPIQETLESQNFSKQTSETKDLNLTSEIKDNEKAASGAKTQPEISPKQTSEPKNIYSKSKTEDVEKETRQTKTQPEISPKQTSEPKNIDTKSKTKDNENTASGAKIQPEISSKQTSEPKNIDSKSKTGEVEKETSQTKTQPEISPKQTSEPKNIDSRSKMGDVEKETSQTKTQPEISSKQNSETKDVNSISKTKDNEKATSGAKTQPDISPKQTSETKDVNSKSKTKDNKKAASGAEIQPEISSKQTSEAENIDSKNKTKNNEKAASRAEIQPEISPKQTSLPKNEFSQEGHKNKEIVTKSEIKDPIIKEIFTFMERIDKRLNEKSPMVKKEVFKIDTDVQFSSQSQFSGKYHTQEKVILQHALPKPKKSLKNSKMCKNDCASKCNTENMRQPKTKIDSRNRKLKTIEKCPVCINNHLKHTNFIELCLCSKPLRQRKKKKYPKPIAYNLILEPCSSILVDSNDIKTNNVLDDVIVKVPKLHGKDKNRTGRQLEKKYVASKKSTNDKLKETSNLNDDNLSDQFNSHELNDLNDESNDIMPNSSDRRLTINENSEPSSSDEPIGKNKAPYRQLIINENSESCSCEEIFMKSIPLNRPFTNSENSKSCSCNKPIEKNKPPRRLLIINENSEACSCEELFVKNIASHRQVTSSENSESCSCEELFMKKIAYQHQLTSSENSESFSREEPTTKNLPSRRTSTTYENSDSSTHQELTLKNLLSHRSSTKNENSDNCDKLTIKNLLSHRTSVKNENSDTVTREEQTTKKMPSRRTSTENDNLDISTREELTAKRMPSRRTSTNNENSDSHTREKVTAKNMPSQNILTGNENSDPQGKEEPTGKRKLTIEDYLVMNRPKFIIDANKRLEYLKNFNSQRKEYESHQRKFFEENLSNISELQNQMNRKSQYPKNYIDKPENQRLFDSKEIIKMTALRYQRLPEIQKQKELLKKQRLLKTNRMIAKIFVKKLQKKALNGVVDISYSSNIISL